MAEQENTNTITPVQSNDMGNTSTNIIVGATFTQPLTHLANTTKKLEETVDSINALGDIASAGTREISNRANEIKALANSITNLTSMAQNASSGNANLESQFAPLMVKLQEVKRALTEGIEQGANNITKAISDAIETQTGMDSSSMTNELASRISDSVSALNEMSETISNVVGNVEQINQQIGKTKEGAEGLQVNIDDIHKSIDETNKQAQTTSQEIEKVQKDYKELASALFDTIQKTDHINESADKFSSTLIQTVGSTIGQQLVDIINTTSNNIVDITQSSNGDVADKGTALAQIGTLFSQAQAAMLEEVRKGSTGESQRKAAAIMEEQMQNIAQTISASKKIYENSIAQGNLTGEALAYAQRKVDILSSAQDMFTNQINEAHQQVKNIIADTTEKEIQQDQERFAHADTDPFVKTALAFNAVSGVNGRFNSMAGLASDSLTALASRPNQSLYYQYFQTGNLLGDTATLRNNLNEVNRTNTFNTIYTPKWVSSLKDAKERGDTDEMASSIVTMTSQTLASGDAIAKMAGGMNFLTGGAANLSEADKKIFNNFEKSVKQSLDNINAVIQAIQEVDPKNTESLEKLREQQRILRNISDKVDDVKGKSGALGGVIDTFVGGLKSGFGAFTTGLGVMGLGGLLSPIGMIQGGIKAEEEEGKRRYNLARAAYAMGAAPDQTSIIQGARDIPRYYYALTNGMIGMDEYHNYQIGLMKNVGGHYGESPTQGRRDLEEISRNTFAIAKSRDISDGTIQQFMQTFYKDLRMSASEATGALIDMTQTAISAGVPVEKYVSTMAGLASRMRDTGMDGRQTMSVMNSLMQRGLRMEDATSLVQSMGNAIKNMAGDYNQSMFWGMATGQGSNPFEAGLSGVLSHNADGSVNPEYYGNMAQRVIARASFFGAAGGGPTSDLGVLQFKEQLDQMGYTGKDASMMADAYRKGDTSLLASLMAQADENKEDNKAKHVEALVNANKQLAAFADQLAETDKNATAMTLAEQQLGIAIHDYLAGPLATFRNGFANALTTIVEQVSKFADALSAFFQSDTFSGTKNFVTEHPIMTAVGAIGAGVGIAALARGGGGLLRSLGSRALSSGAGGNIAKFAAGAGTLASGLTLALGAGALVGGAYLVLKLLTEGNAKVQVVGAGGSSASAMPIAPQNFGDVASETAWSAAQNQDLLMRLSGRTPSQYAESMGMDADYAEAFNKEYNERQEKANQAVIDKLNSDIGKKLRHNEEQNEEHPESQSSMMDNVMLAGSSAFLGMSALNMASKAIFSGTSAADAFRVAKARGFGPGMKGNALLSLAFSGGKELYDAWQNPDKFTAGERIERFGADAILGTGGSVIGGMLGSFLGPAGTFVGMMAGGYAGNWLAEKYKKWQGISNEDGEKNLVEKSKKDIEEARRKYGNSSEILAGSNKERAEAAQQGLQEHNRKLSEMSAEQQQYMDRIFNELKQMGLQDGQAAYLAAQTVGQMDDSLEKAAAKAWNNGNGSYELKAKMFRYYAGEAEKEGEAGYEEKQDALNAYALGYDYLADNSKEEQLRKLLTEEYKTNKYIRKSLSGAAQDSQKGFNSQRKESINFNNSNWIDDLSQEEFKQLMNAVLATNTQAAYTAYNSGALRTVGGNKLDTSQSQMFNKFYKAENINKKNNADVASDARKATGLTPLADAGAQSGVQTQMAQSGLSGSANAWQNYDFRKAEQFAKEQVGKPYVFAAKGPDAWDCSGYASAILRAGGMDVNGDADDIAKYFESHGAAPKRYSGDGKDLAEGSVVFWRGKDDNGEESMLHVAYMGQNGTLYNAGSSDTGVYSMEGIYDVAGREVYVSTPGSINYSDTQSSSLSQQQPSTMTPEQASNAVLSMYQSKLGEMQGGMTNKEFARDKIASGQLIIDDVSALSPMRMGDVYNRFIQTSGIKDSDRYGVSIGGAFDGQGRMMANGGVFDIRRKIDEYKSGGHAYKFDNATIESLSASEATTEDAAQKLGNEVDSANSMVENTFKPIKEIVEQMAEKNTDKAEDKEKMNVTVTIIESKGSDKNNTKKTSAIRATMDNIISAISSHANAINTISGELQLNDASVPYPAF